MNNLMKVSLTTCLVSCLSVSAQETIRGQASITQHCVYNVQSTSPDARYTFANEGKEVIDTVTNLTWSRCEVGQSWDNASKVCIGEPLELNWEQAHAEAVKYTLSDGDEWRVPNIKELTTLLESRCSQPQVNAFVFPSTYRYSFFLSSTVQAREDKPNNIYILAMLSGSVEITSKTDVSHVKLVKMK